MESDLFSQASVHKSSRKQLFKRRKRRGRLFANNNPLSCTLANKVCSAHTQKIRMGHEFCTLVTRQHFDITSSSSLPQLAKWEKTTVHKFMDWDGSPCCDWGIRQRGKCWLNSHTAFVFLNRTVSSAACFVRSCFSLWRPPVPSFPGDVAIRTGNLHVPCATVPYFQTRPSLYFLTKVLCACSWLGSPRVACWSTWCLLKFWIDY